jgi:ribokinase
MLLVFGSINIDLVFRVDTLPGPGDTVLAPGYVAVPGGKGANQAVAAARDGARVRMVGRVGRDAFARLALDSLEGAGVDTAGVAQADAPTGCAAIGVDRAGENQIIVASGANAQVGDDQVDDAALGPETTLVLQMEVAANANAALIRRARRKHARIVLNLAPFSGLPDDALRAVDVVAVNGGEAARLAASLGIADGEVDGDDVALAASLAARLGVAVVLTCGGRGAVAASRDGVWTVDALPIAPVDTTGAGDAFVGVLAAALDRGQALEDALHRASVAAGLACLTLGAQTSLPSRAAIDGALARLAPARRQRP